MQVGSVVGPEGDDVAWRAVEGIALGDGGAVGGCAGGLVVEEAVAGDDADAVGEVGVAFKLDAAGADAAGLHAEVGVLRVGGEDVVFAEVEGGDGEEAVEVSGLILQPDLMLLTGGGFELLAFDVDADRRLEGGGVAVVGADAVAGKEDSSGASGEGVIGLLLRSQGDGIEVFGVGPVFASADGDGEALVEDLVLAVDAGLIELDVVVASIAGGGDGGAVLRMEDVEGWGREIEAVGLAEGKVLEVDAHEDDLLDTAAVDGGAGVGVDGGCVHVLVVDEGIARDGAVIREQATGVDVAEAIAEVHIAEVLLDGPGAAERAGEKVGGVVLASGMLVPSGLAGVEAGGDDAKGICRDGAGGREEIVEADLGVVLIVEEGGEGGLFVGPPCEGGRDHVALDLVELHLRVGIADEADEAVEVVTGAIERAAEVPIALEAVVHARGEVEGTVGSRFGLLAFKVGETRRVGLPEEHGGGTVENFDALQVEGVEGGEKESGGAVGEAHAVEVLLHDEAASAECLVGSAVDTTKLGHHACAVAKRLRNGLYALHVHLIASDDGDGLGNFAEWSVGLGGGGCGDGDVAAVGVDIDRIADLLDAEDDVAVLQIGDGPGDSGEADGGDLEAAGGGGLRELIVAVGIGVRLLRWFVVTEQRHGGSGDAGSRCVGHRSFEAVSLCEGSHTRERDKGKEQTPGEKARHSGTAFRKKESMATCERMGAPLPLRL